MKTKKRQKMQRLSLPKKFQSHSLCGWSTFNCDLENYLSGLRGIVGVPLIYVICKDWPMSETQPEDEVEQLI